MMSRLFIPLSLHAGGTVRYSAAASQKTRERIARALPGSGHRMFLLNRKVAAPIGSEGGPVELFDVLGATGNGRLPPPSILCGHCIFRKLECETPCVAATGLHRL